MKYLIVYLIKGEAEKYHQKLVNDIGPKFGEDYLIENPLPSHVTLKSPFKTGQIKNLEKVLHNFSKTHKAGKIQIGDFGNFNKIVIFLKVNFSKDSQKVQRDLLKAIKDIEGIDLHEFDKNHNSHSTIAYSNTKETFNHIWNYILKLEKPKFNTYFDNIAILKKPRKFWKVHKIYKLNK